MGLSFPEHPTEQIAVIEGELHVTYGELYQRIDAQVKALSKYTNKSFFVVEATNTLSVLVQYLAILKTGHCAMLVSDELANDALEQLLQAYQPQGIFDRQGLTELDNQVSSIGADVALLMSTSGSTGDPKQVALSYTNLYANAESICAFLPIKPSDKTLANLPMHYAYGLSVINSHLLVGATLVFTTHTPVEPNYWALLESTPIHSIAGVPHSYEMLARLGFTKRLLPQLRYLTQAGGKLNPRWVKHFNDYCHANQKQFFIMYGQTEATARMGWLAPESTASKPESIGKAIPNGEFSLIDLETGNPITQTNQQGELIYQGPNVMLGYVNSRLELAQFDSINQLHTGDLAYVDDDGDYYITGRLKRMIKIHGQRIALDAVEARLSGADKHVVCCGKDNLLTVLSDTHVATSAIEIAKLLHIHPSTVRVQAPVELLYTTNGKYDYASMQERYGA